MSRVFEIPNIARIGPNRWRVQWAGQHPFELDDGAFSTLVRSLPQVARDRLFERLADALSRKRRKSGSHE